VDQQTAQAIAKLRQELAQLRTALGVLTPDEAEAALHGISYGLPWQSLAMPPGASGTASWRPHAGGLLALEFALSWRSAPGTALLAGVPRSLWPRLPWSDGTVSVAGNGLVTLDVSGTQLRASVLVPYR
jgi:hypothetical protein